MKLMALFLLAAVFQVHASGHAQTVTYSAKAVPLQQLFTIIKQQTGYVFFYSPEDLKNTKPVSVQLHQVDLTMALQEILKDQPLKFKIEGNTILISLREAPAKATNIFGLEAFFPITGIIRDASGNLLVGATVRVKGKNVSSVTDNSGGFQIAANQGDVLVVSYVGFSSREFTIKNSDVISITLTPLEVSLDTNVVIINTGYQNIPKERTTGSFTKVDNQLLNRRVSANIIDRLEGVTSGLIFNGNFTAFTDNDSKYSIRGLSTIFANAKPLIIVDNFPFDGDLSNLNPNDVLDVTVLKDAAAASIWGARSGNGVIVITTKKGKTGQSLDISFNSNLTYTEKPDVYYGANFLNSSDFIESEKFLFGKGFYDNDLNTTLYSRPVVSPVVELLAKQRGLPVTDIAGRAQIDNQIDAYRKFDLRDNISKYLYQSTLAQQYALNLSGSSKNASYYISSGYDRAPSVNTGNSYERKSFNSNLTITPIRNLQVTTGLTYTLSNNVNNALTFFSPESGKVGYYPYAQFADADGNALGVEKNYRSAYIQGLGTSQLLDWTYKPLNELQYADNTIKTTYIKFNAGFHYSILKGLSADVLYQLEKQSSLGRNYQSQDSYYARNLINLNTLVSGTTVNRAIPLGGILDQSNNNLTGNSIRSQLNFSRVLNKDHEITALAGIDGKELVTNQQGDRLYGYNDLIGTSSVVDYKTQYAKYQDLSFPSTILYLNTRDRLDDVFFSYFANASYAYLSRYFLSGSFRVDQSNLFGVNTNQKSIPLWSVGLAYDISKESFLQTDWLNYLKLRATYGYNGNIDKSVSAFTTARFSNNSTITGAPFVTLVNPPNPELRWERIKTINIGLDFEIKNKLLKGSIEYYRKKGNDIIGFASVDPTVGVKEIKGNLADIGGDGIDLDLTLSTGNKLQWLSTVLISKATDKVTSYNRTTTVSAYLQSGDGSLGTLSLTPIVGKPIYSIYSYPSAGLDPINGDPRGYVNGQISKDYATIANSTDLNTVKYHGSAKPTLYGAFRNALSYKSFSISANVTYKLGYYFRRPSISYNDLAYSWTQNASYTQRWQRAGDELITNVPSFTYPLNVSRDNFYKYSDSQVEKGDHIRLQDIQISYDFGKLNGHSPFKALQFYAYANNLGILWKASKGSVDPDFINKVYINPKTFSIGIKATF